MANLITEKQKKVVFEEYLIRLWAVVLSLVCLAGIFLLAYMIPYYFSLLRNDLIISEQLKSVISTENKENVGESVGRVANRLNDQMKAVEVYLSKPLSPSLSFAKVLENKSPNVSVNRLGFKMLNSKEVQIFVSGVAQNRQALVGFISDLKSKGGFASVESPVSDFAKDSNISFTVTIKTSI
jgi:hypothetical protein